MDTTTNYEDFINTNFDEFYIKNIIGTGGMGVVYRAFDRDLGRDVALKVLKKEAISDDNKLLERFKIEGINIANLQHPNIINIFSIGYCHGLNYIVMEYVNGDKLSDLLCDGKLSVVECLNIILKVAKALEYSHHHGIIHRDIKPANIMISYDSKEVKVVDFGLSKKTSANNETISQIGDIIGTPVYLAPELWETSQNVTYKSDVYSLGVVLYECLTGKLPFIGKSPHDVYKSILLNRYVEAIDVNQNIPISLNILINKMIKRDPIVRADLSHVIREIEYIIKDLVLLTKIPSTNNNDLNNRSTIISGQNTISKDLEISYKKTEKLTFIILFIIFSISLGGLGIFYFI